MKLLFFFFAVSVMLALATTIHAAALDEKQAQNLFVEFSRRYDKQYEMKDFFRRFGIFRENLDWIINFNNDKSNTHQVGVNYFADMTPDEWQNFKGLKFPSTWKEPDYKKFDSISQDGSDDATMSDINQRLLTRFGSLDEPDKMDWKEYLNPIRNQFSCGSCYVFAAVTTIEALYNFHFQNDSKAEHMHEYYSIQQGLDCTGPQYGNYYCQGGWPASVYDYLIKTPVCTEESYPYQNKRTSCKDKTCEAVARIGGYKDISGYPEATLVKGIAINPVAIAITSNNREFMFYKSGVLSRCGTSTQPDHAVVASGYDISDEDPNKRYFIVHNSWGQNWGDEGRIRIKYGGNVCKIRSNLHFPTIT